MTNKINVTSTYAIVIPVANEENTISFFYSSLIKALKNIGINYKLYFITDKASKDNTLKILKNISVKNKNCSIIYEPKNKHVVDAYMRGYKQALSDGNDFIIEMDSGFSHQPDEIVKFVCELNKGYDCVFGVRPLLSPTYKVPISRRFYSLGGTILSNVLLGTKLSDATSGFEAFKASVLQKIIAKPLQSHAHFFQTEIKYRAKQFNYTTVKITYTFPSKSISSKSIYNSIYVLFSLFRQRLMSNLPL